MKTYRLIGGRVRVVSNHWETVYGFVGDGFHLPLKWYQNRFRCIWEVV